MLSCTQGLRVCVESSWTNFRPTPVAFSDGGARGRRSGTCLRPPPQKSCAGSLIPLPWDESGVQDRPGRAAGILDNNVRLLGWDVIPEDRTPGRKVCATLAIRVSTGTTPGQQRAPRAPASAGSSACMIFGPLRRPHRTCAPPFRGGLRPPHSEKKEGEKTPQAPARPPIPRERDFIFYHSS